MFSGAAVALHHLGLSIPRTVGDVAKAEGVGWMSSTQGRMGAVGVVSPCRQVPLSSLDSG